ncbi:YkoY family integral membrane protein [Chitinophaga niastensis]|uniref:YkoY family integral membrane protein n=1 Tax=Chitinophaga niastensis TaxID=536980 RepID=A0A2P8HHD0_CHINA|nr:TerC family protein [Chitinophaga niastensis]PSL45625.1 YkoY family integral membrane protein [Chitinophaga niastensis]
MSELIQQIIDNPLPSLIVVGNLVIIESLLSVDNAAVLATMVMDLPEKQRDRALKYGIFGAYFFRGLAMIFASFLIKIWWLKPIGGLYLLYLVYGWWKGKQAEGEKEEETVDKGSNWLYKATVGAIGPFWATVALVELMDMAFSIDNIFAAVAFTDNIVLVCTGVFIGILAMRFVAQAFVKLMTKYVFLEAAAFIVIAILGIKLTMSLFEHFFPESPVTQFLESSKADVITSILTVGIFLIPIITSALFNFPKKTVAAKTEV